MYKAAPTTTIVPKRLPGRKKRKERITFLVCANSDGSLRVAPLAVGKSQKPRCFQGREGWEYGFNYVSSKEAWMNHLIFFQWLHHFDYYISLTTGRRAVLLLDNCSSHGEVETIPDLLHVFVLFLPKNTTSRLQTFHAGVISSLEKRYTRMRIQKAINLIELGNTDTRKFTIAMSVWLWNSFSIHGIECHQTSFLIVGERQG